MQVAGEFARQRRDSNRIELLENQILIEFRSKHKVSSSLLNMQQLGTNYDEKMNELKNKMRGSGI